MNINDFLKTNNHLGECIKVSYRNNKNDMLCYEYHIIVKNIWNYKKPFIIQTFMNYNLHDKSCSLNNGIILMTNMYDIEITPLSIMEKQNLLRLYKKYKMNKHI